MMPIKLRLKFIIRALQFFSSCQSEQLFLPVSASLPLSQTRSKKNTFFGHFSSKNIINLIAPHMIHFLLDLFLHLQPKLRSLWVLAFMPTPFHHMHIVPFEACWAGLSVRVSVLEKQDRWCGTWESWEGLKEDGIFISFETKSDRT